MTIVLYLIAIYQSIDEQYMNIYIYCYFFIFFDLLENVWEYGIWDIGNIFRIVELYQC